MAAFSSLMYLLQVFAYSLIELFENRFYLGFVYGLNFSRCSVLVRWACIGK